MEPTILCFWSDRDEFSGGYISQGSDYKREPKIQAQVSYRGISHKNVCIPKFEIN